MGSNVTKVSNPNTILVFCMSSLLVCACAQFLSCFLSLHADCHNYCFTFEISHSTRHLFVQVHRWFCTQRNQAPNINYPIRTRRHAVSSKDIENVEPLGPTLWTQANVSKQSVAYSTFRRFAFITENSSSDLFSLLGLLTILYRLLRVYCIHVCEWPIMVLLFYGSTMWSKTRTRTNYIEISWLLFDLI